VTPELETPPSHFQPNLELSDLAASDLPPELHWAAPPRWMRSMPEQWKQVQDQGHGAQNIEKP
jgi:hypothetical protein